MMLRFCRSAALGFTLSGCVIASASAQTPPFVFMMTVPEKTPREAVPPALAVVEERGLALWGGTASDFGVGVSLSGSRWTLRSIASMTALPVDGHSRPTFQQIEIIRPIFSRGSISVAGGGGVRQEWDGTRVIVGRLLAGSNIGPGRLQGSLVMERAVSSPLRRDVADVVTSLGWSRRVGNRFSVGVESIGQDLEGLWNRAEADGGAKLLVGPSIHAHSTTGSWAASLTAGPVVHTIPTGLSPDLSAVTSSSVRHHFGIFASGSWVPSLRR